MGDVHFQLWVNVLTEMGLSIRYELLNYRLMDDNVLYLEIPITNLDGKTHIGDFVTIKLWVDTNNWELLQELLTFYELIPEPVEREELERLLLILLDLLVQELGPEEAEEVRQAFLGPLVWLCLLLPNLFFLGLSF